MDSLEDRKRKKVYEANIAAAQAAYKEKTSKAAEQKTLQEDLRKIDVDKAKAEAARAIVDEDMARGKEKGQEILGPEGLGRLGSDVEVQEILSKYKDVSEQGLGRQEVAAQRAESLRAIQGQGQTAVRGLQASLARAGVKGAVAGQQIMQRNIETSRQVADVEQNLFLKSEDIRRQGLADYSQKVGDVKTYDLGQAAAEKDILMQSSFGYAQLGSAERSAEIQAKYAKEASIAAAAAGRPSCFLGSTMLTSFDGSKFYIKDAQPGMRLFNGDYILGTTCHLATDPLYEYNGVSVTGCHFVWHKGEFIPVAYTGAPRINYDIDNLYVYNLITSSGIIDINGTTFSDYDDDYLKELYEEISRVC